MGSRAIRVTRSATRIVLLAAVAVVMALGVSSALAGPGFHPVPPRTAAEQCSRAVVFGGYSPLIELSTYCGQR
jgi:hypothetical protein